MAKPIEPTPVLENEDAKAFWKSTENLKFDKNKEIELEKSRVIYRFFSKKSAVGTPPSPERNCQLEDGFI